MKDIFKIVVSFETGVVKFCLTNFTENEKPKIREREYPFENFNLSALSRELIDRKFKNNGTIIPYVFGYIYYEEK